uniref:ADA32 protein n=1 Tax=Strigops habroptila TaxID=2489341 RepID=A0A672U744_STRHB
LSIEGRPYTIRLQPHCYYRGYIDGFPSSSVTLSTCSGLRGLLQFENITYGIEPLGYSPAFEHFVYRVRDGKAAGPLLERKNENSWLTFTRWDVGNHHLSVSTPFCFMVVNALSALMCSWVIFQYDYMGSDTKAATQKIIQVFNLVNNMFNPLNVTVVLSSLELWTDKNKVSTAGEAEDLLQRFLQWAKSHLALQPYDTAYLLVYRHQAAFVGTTAPGKVCQRDAAGVVPQPRSLLLYLGIGYDESPQCHCPRHVCIMSPEALHFSGVKAFSSCSIRDFEAFLRHGGGMCLFSRPRLTGLSSRRAAVCGNGIVEPGEQCDCGAACSKDKCCTTGCQFKPGVKCSSGLCCNDCQFKRKHSQCRPAADEQCDLAEFCTGASASCPPDLYVQDGHGCEHGTGYCYKGRCQSPDLQCQQLYGKGSKNAPVACYEELNSQRDRFGHCGLQPRQGYKSCSWRYAWGRACLIGALQLRKASRLQLIVRFAKLDPILVPPGTKCGTGKVCINNTCHPHSVLGYDCNSKVKCHGHGVSHRAENLMEAEMKEQRIEGSGARVDTSVGWLWGAGGLWCVEGVPIPRISSLISAATQKCGWVLQEDDVSCLLSVSKLSCTSECVSYLIHFLNDLRVLLSAHGLVPTPPVVEADAGWGTRVCCMDSSQIYHPSPGFPGVQ